MFKIDEVDKKILRILQKNARISNADIAREVHLVPSATLERVKRLEKLGIIKGYHACIDTSLLGLNLLAFVNLKTENTVSAKTVINQLVKYDEIQELHHVAGEDCYLLKIRAKDVPTYSKFLHDNILQIEGVRDSRSVIVMHTNKETIELPLEEIRNER